jgi:hypothetical protein
MEFSKLSACRLTRLRQRLVVVIGLCAIFLAVPSTTGPGNDAAEFSAKQLRIKRLKLADPESTEVMLADRGLGRPSQSQSLS